MAEGRLPKIKLKWMPKQKRAWGRLKKNWMEVIWKAMNERKLNEGQWEDRKQLSVGVRQRRTTFWNRHTYIHTHTHIHTYRHRWEYNMAHVRCMLDDYCLYIYIYIYIHTHTNTGSECLILIAPVWQQWLHERAWMLLVYEYCLHSWHNWSNSTDGQVTEEKSH